MTRIGTICVAVLLVAMPLGCRQSVLPDQYNLVMVGCPSMIPLIERIADRYREQNQISLRVSVEPASSERTTADTRAGLADIGLLGQPPSRAEVGLTAVTLAYDGLAFLVHRDNPVKNVDPAQLARLLTREEPTWPVSSWTGGSVQLVGQPRIYCFRESLQERLGLVPGAIRLDVVAGTSEQVVQEVARRPTALGWLSLAHAERLCVGQPVHLLGISGVPATLANFRAARYTFSRPLVLLTRRSCPSLVHDFIQFARSDSVHDLIEEHGFLPAEPGK
jgi:phosphate transport system substrate-binding protein